MKILVTGIGGPAGLNVASLLPSNSLGAVCDSDPAKRRVLLEAGIDARFYPVPRGMKENAFKHAINDIIMRENIDVIIPTVDEELMTFSYRPGHFNARVVVSPYETVRVCNDKAMLYDSVSESIPCPRYVVTDNRQDLAVFGSNPVFMRHRVGRGSKGAKLFNNYSEIPAELITKDNIFSEYLPGQEYTVDVLCGMEAEPLVIVPRKRIEVRNGISIKGATEKHAEISENVKKLCSLLKFIGPSNMQFKADSYGKMKLVEINPRFSGGLPITAESGANTPELLLRLLSGESVSSPEWREGVFENSIIKR